MKSLQQPPNPRAITKPRVSLTQRFTANWKYIVAALFLVAIVLIIIRPLVFKEKLVPTLRKKKRPRGILQTITAAATSAITTTISPPSQQHDYSNPAYMDACYSMRVVVPSYTGPVVRIEKNDGTQQDIFTDANQSFLTVDPNNQGVSLEDWLGAQVGKVRVWYDQSGNNNHATCYNYCPIISTLNSSKYVLRFQQYTDSGLRMNDPVKPYAIFFQFWHDNNDPAKIISTDVDPAIDRYYGVVIENGDVYGNKSQYDWYYSAEGNKDLSVNQENSPDYDLGEWNTVCLSVDNPNYSADNNQHLNLIGKDLSGYLSELILYNRVMSQDDMSDYNSNEFDVAD